LAETLGLLGDCLLAGQKYAEAEALLRETLKIQQKQPKTEPEGRADWQAFNTQALLGGCLLRQGKHAEAEPLLLRGYEGLKGREKRITTTGRKNLREAAEQLAQLYDKQGQKDRAAEWREKGKQVERNAN
jgi:tetratricopeptide (TPR) repeat protein